MVFFAVNFNHFPLSNDVLIYGALIDVINLDRFNLFLRGLTFCGRKMIYHLFSGFIQFHNLVSSVTYMLTSGLLNYRWKHLKKPPDKLVACATAMVACSSVADHSLDTSDAFKESFDQEEKVIVGLDTLYSRHLFYSISDFVKKIDPIKPFISFSSLNEPGIPRRPLTYALVEKKQFLLGTMSYLTLEKFNVFIQLFRF